MSKLKGMIYISQETKAAALNNFIEKSTSLTDE